MSKYIQKLKYKLRELLILKSGEIDPERYRRIQKLIDRIEHAFSTRNIKDLSINIDKFCEELIEIIK